MPGHFLPDLNGRKKELDRNIKSSLVLITWINPEVIQKQTKARTSTETTCLSETVQVVRSSQNPTQDFSSSPHEPNNGHLSTGNYCVPRERHHSKTISLYNFKFTFHTSVAFLSQTHPARHRSGSF